MNDKVLTDCSGASDSLQSVRAIIILAGGTACRLGGVSKPDYRVNGKRLLDILLHELNQTGFTGATVVVGPENLEVPSHVMLTLEDPPFGGPLAGIQAGLNALAFLSNDDAVLLATCDAPLSPRILPKLTAQLSVSRQIDGAIPLELGNESWPQYVHGLYRFSALRDLHFGRDRSIRSVFRTLNATLIPDDDDVCFDVDTPEAAEILEKRLAGELER
ncbi:molybdenum cofactor guanylyltransferase [Arcanobacterium ihumii]|uniref:molybdenum cofactor guanylyltransferase n=1 Tax=Arcanobacterium ihumii TaxID=2138162 RepID=UPI000F53F9BA|nr:NTP transferase domain-containing protein [Arcanobacterium ihumii]